MITWGISANSHDAAIAVFDGFRLLFASHSERYTRIKNDKHISIAMVRELKRKYGEPKQVFWYEKPLQKFFRQIRAGQGIRIKDNNIKAYLKSYEIDCPVTFIEHHLSHAAATYYTSRFKDSAVLVVDSIGEFDTTSIWKGQGNQLNKLWNRSYPNSLGLFYSAMTQRIGLKPQEDEYILMGMAAYGDPSKFKDRILEDMWAGEDLKMNLHRGCLNWAREFDRPQDLFDIAAATQSIYEDRFRQLLIKTKELTGSNRLALAGGCALNCVSNVIAYEYFDSVWIFPNPGDSGSAIGAVLANNKNFIQIDDCFLGHNIEGEYPIREALTDLLDGKVIGVANGRAEFGPRALGNRSLLADPRTDTMKERVNTIKQRQQFRPFAPAILEEFANEYFELPDVSSRFMQYAVRCKCPELIPAVIHKDGTSRVQTVPQGNNGFRLLLEEWYDATGCPVLLNTSLNIKGQPIVNTRREASEFADFYNVPVHQHQK
jgi:carbamoyltransferase